MKYTLLLLSAACSTDVPVAEVVPEPVPPTTVQAPAQADVTDRVGVAHAHMDTTDGGKLLRSAIDAHGGLENWFAPGTFSFDFDYQRVARPDKRRYSRNEIDVWSARVRQTELGDGADAVFGWDGENSWMSPNDDAFSSSASFWSLTPYYFVGIPWVLSDPGTTHTAQGTVELTDETGTTHSTEAVKVTFDPGTGQAPDDYYVLHTDSETHQVVALRYIVTGGRTREPGSPPPRETVMFYRDHQWTDGLKLLVANHLDSFHYADNTVGEPGSIVDVANVNSGASLPIAGFSGP